MGNGRNERIREIFEACLGEDSPEARADLVTRECRGDSELESMVVDLLEAHEAGCGFLEGPLDRVLDGRDDEDLARTVDLPPSADRLSRRIGSYTLREKIGEGGFGVVYVADQAEPVCRKVAVKIIKPGMDTEDVIARFEAERRALAMMDHPNIARVLDAGTTGEPGRPYFVMELVPGCPITEFCDERKLSTPERLQLFVDVCRAVQHAHQKGIIHRDLKPTNVLVATRDGRPVVKVIDFGVAKALSQRLTDVTLYTAYGQMVGTPLYMSPEQAELSNLDVDTRSDVYSLGVLLYELLTGTTPFEKETLKKAGYDEMRRIIHEVDPPRPSTRVGSVKSVPLSTLAESRRIDPRRFVQHLRGELDWIVMKALEKDRNRRYQSAADLAEDVERFLNSQPVEACPPSRFYRFRKFARRNRGLLVASLIVVVSLIAGAAVATWQWFEADAARILADERLAGEIAAHKEADRERDRARESAALARRLLYASDMVLAGDAYRRNDVTRLREILVRHVPAPREDDLRGFEWHFLWKQSGMKSREVLSCGQPLYFVCVSKDGRLMAAAGKDGVIRIFDGRTFRSRTSFDSGQTEVNGLAFSPDGRSLASTGDNGTIAVWNVAGWKCKWRIQAHSGLALQVAYTDDGKQLVSCGRDSAIWVRNASTGKMFRQINRHRSPVECLSISSGGVLAAGYHDGTVSLWDVKTWKRLSQQRHGQPGDVTGIAFSPSDDFIAYGQLWGTLSVVDCARKARVAWQTLPQGLQCLACATLDPKSPKGSSGKRPTWMAVGDREGNIHLMPLDLVSGQSGIVPGGSSELMSRQWAAHRGRVYSVAFSPNGRHLISAGEDGRLLVSTIGDLAGYRRIDVEASGFDFLDAHRIVTTVRDEPKCLIVDLERGKAPPAWLPTAPHCGNKIHVAARSGDVFISNPAASIVRCRRNGKPSAVWDAGKSGRVSVFGVSPDGTRLGLSVLLDPQTKDREFVLIDSGAGKPSGSRLSTLDSRLNRWRVIHREKCDQVHAIRFSPDGRYVAFDNQKCVHVLDAGTGRRVAVLRKHNTTINDLQFSPDGQFIASVSGDRKLKVWKWKTGRTLYSAIAHHHSAQGLSFSPDGRTIATVGDDGMLRLWRWRLNRMLIEFPLEEWPVRFVQISTDGRRIAVGGKGRTVQIYDGSPTERMTVNSRTTTQETERRP